VARGKATGGIPGVPPAKQVAGFIAKFDPRMTRLIGETRKAMRRRFPSAHELVYDNYNFLVFGFGGTERPSDCFVSLAANAKGVGLCFLYGAKLKDPQGILLGSGNQTRFIRLENAATLEKPEVKELLDAAMQQAKAPLPRVGKGKLIVRSIAVKQRPRRIEAAEAGKSACRSSRLESR
jgi:hypothetical protein